jgi:hypothetical protein
MQARIFVRPQQLAIVYRTGASEVEMPPPTFWQAGDDVAILQKVFVPGHDFTLLLTNTPR